MNYKFRNFNNSKKKIVSQEETLEILEETFYQGFPKKERQKLFKDPINLAKYAFENYTTYYLTFYKNTKPFVNLNSGDGTFDLSFLDTDIDGNVFIYLTMSCLRVDPLKRFHYDEYEPLPNGQVFLNQIVLFTNDEIESSRKEMKFIFKDEEDPEDKLIITERRFLKKDNSVKKTVEETTEINLSNNYFRTPQHFYDYEYLFDYENLLKPEYIQK